MWYLDPSFLNSHAGLTRHSFPDHWLRETKTLGTRMVLRVYGLFFCPSLLFLFFLSFCCSCWPSTGLASSSRIPESLIETEILTAEYPSVSGGILLEFFTPISEHFRAYFSRFFESLAFLQIALKRSFPPAGRDIVSLPVTATYARI